MCYEPLDPRDEAELGTDDEEPLDEDCPVCCFERDSTPGKVVKHLEQRHEMRMSPIQRAAGYFMRMTPAEMVRCQIQISAPSIAATIGAAAAETAKNAEAAKAAEAAETAAREARYRSIEAEALQEAEEQKLWDERAKCWKFGFPEADPYSRYIVRTFEAALTNVEIVKIDKQPKDSKPLAPWQTYAQRSQRPLTTAERNTIGYWVFQSELSSDELLEKLGTEKKPLASSTYGERQRKILRKLGATSREHAITIILAQMIQELQVSPF